jgi:hypothetical protein
LAEKIGKAKKKQRESEDANDRLWFLLSSVSFGTRRGVFFGSVRTAGFENY